MDYELTTFFRYKDASKRSAEYGPCAEMTGQSFIPRIGDQISVPDEWWSDISPENFALFYDEPLTVETVIVYLDEDGEPSAQVFCNVEERETLMVQNRRLPIGSTL